MRFLECICSGLIHEENRENSIHLFYFNRLLHYSHLSFFDQSRAETVVGGASNERSENFNTLLVGVWYTYIGSDLLDSATAYGKSIEGK